MKTLVWCPLIVGLLASSARADSPLQIARAEERLRVDGSLREWKGARFVPLGQGEGALRYALAHRDGGLYVAAEIEDPKVVRRRGVGPGQDALVLRFAMPTRAQEFAHTEVWLHPGLTGRTAAAAGVGAPGKRPRPARGVKVVEGPVEDGSGYILEAFIPWQAVREADLWQMGRGALRYENASRRGELDGRVQTSSARRASDLPRLLPGQGELDLVRAFLKHQNRAAAEPSHDFKADVQGDRRPERVTVVDRYVLVTGPGIADGTSYQYMELPLGLGGGVRTARLRELTGDRYPELVLELRQKNQLGARVLWSVVQLSGGSPRRLFAVETAKQVGGGSVRAKLTVHPGKPARVRVERGRAEGLDPGSLRESPPSDAEPILLPWQPVRARVYGYVDGRFVKLDEEVDPEAEAQGPAQVAAPAGEPTGPAPPPPPSQKALVAAAKAEAGIASAQQPDHHLRANVAGDGAPEHLFVFGARAILVGPGIGGGERYVSYGLPLSDPRDLRDLQLADVTGDGGAELLIRVRQALGSDGVEREVLLVQRHDGGGLERILATEVSRWHGERRIDNRVRVQGGQLRIAPGKARGWSRDAYPFPDEPVGGVGRLLLPWSDREVRYRFAGGKLQQG